MNHRNCWLHTSTWLCGAGLLLMSLSACSPRDPFPMRKVDWENRMGGNGNLNMISHLDPEPGHPEVHRYWTGGTSSGRTPLSTWPDRQVSRVVHGNVTVRLHAFAGDVPANADERAMQIARIVASAAGIWPGPDARVEIDTYLVPPDVSYQYARLISWRQGDPYRLTLFLGLNGQERGLQGGETAAHELFHVMERLAGRGTKPAGPDDRPGLLHLANEVFAEIYAACGSLLANGERRNHINKNSIAIDGKKYEGYLTGAEIRYFFDHYATTKIIEMSGPMMAGSAFRAFYGDKDLIRADEPAGREMLALCARIAPDHGLLTDWLLALD